MESLTPEQEYLVDLASRTREALLLSATSALELSVGAQNELDRVKIETVGHLVEHTVARLVTLGVRPKSIANIQECLARIGLELRHGETELPVEQETFEPIPPPQKQPRQRKSKAEAAGLTEERVREIVKESFTEMLGSITEMLGSMVDACNEKLHEQALRLDSEVKAIRDLESILMRHSQEFTRIERLEARAQSFEIEANNFRANAGERFNEARRLNEDYTRCAQRTTFLEQRADKLEVLAEKLSNKIVDAALAKVFS